ncbi:MAG: hypothetical protein JW891_03000 [Candidatus Lokiarchaeota archaeon]|nr:hypothetical protein [Candidatus Lokiarchaeota archaeon]
MKKAKGTIILYIIKGIKSNKTDAYKKLLSKDAKKLVSQNILPSEWYPFEAYKECMVALARVETEGNMEIVRDWGRMFGQKIMTDLYGQIIEEGDVRKALDKYKRFQRIIFNFGSINIKFISEKDINISFTGFDPNFQEYYELAMGWIEKFVELCVGKKPKSIFLNKSWEGDEITKFRISW